MATVLITGASSGIGRAAALAFARRGDHVLLVARRAEVLDEVVDAIGAAGGRATAWPCDLADADAVADLARGVTAEHGVPDVLVNNAGAGRWRAVEETEAGEALRMMAVPYLAAFELTRALVPGMIARGSGWILTVNSPAAWMVFPGASGYAAGRAALRWFAEGLALELQGTGVGTTHLVAGEVSSAYFEANPGSHERLPWLSRWYPVLTPEQVADALVDAVVRRRRHVVVPWAMWATWVAFELAPWLVRPLVWGTAWRPPRTR